MKYLPFLSGTYTTAPGLTPITKAEGRDRYVFQIDETYDHYIANKKSCREENIKKYYFENKLQPETITAVNQYIVRQLLAEYPDYFHFDAKGERFELINHKADEHLVWKPDWQSIESNSYLSLFDALCCQVQEDIAIFQLTSDTDYLSAIHLCSPNHWAPGEKIGKPFTDIHRPVPAMERTLTHYRKMLEAIVHAPHPSTRFAWGIATDTRLNHHPEAPPGIDQREWQGRKHDKDTVWYIRSERQNLIGFPEVNAFLFTIRTYFYAVDGLSTHEQRMLSSALMSMSPETLRYKGLAESAGFLEDKLIRR
jgi:hypothetical protein